MKKQNIQLKLKNLSKESGVYKMFDKEGNVIYIGKAKNLKNRVSNYFVYSNNSKKMMTLQKYVTKKMTIRNVTKNMSLKICH